MAERLRRQGARTALILLLGVLLYAGLSPFDLLRANGVERSADGLALHFDGGGIVFSERRLEISPGAGELTLEAWIVPDAEHQQREGTIVALMDAGETVPVSLSSRRDALSLRYRIPTADGVATQAISADRALRTGRLHHVAVISGAGGTRVYVDGSSPDQLRARNVLVDAETGLRGYLVMGNSPQGFSGWTGEIRAIALRSRALAEAEIVRHAEIRDRSELRGMAADPDLVGLYVFDLPERSSPFGRVPNLALAAVRGRTDAAAAASDIGPSAAAIRVPERFEVLRWDVLSFPPRVSPLRSSRFRRDILLNLLGFIPLGALLMVYGNERFRRRRWPPRRRFLWSLGVGISISLAIELGQAMLPTRISSVLDLLLNGLGTAIGAGLVAWWQSSSEAGGAAAALPFEPDAEAVEAAAGGAPKDTGEGR